MKSTTMALSGLFFKSAIKHSNIFFLFMQDDRSMSMLLSTGCTGNLCSSAVVTICPLSMFSTPTHLRFMQRPWTTVSRGAPPPPHPANTPAHGHLQRFHINQTPAHHSTWINTFILISIEVVISSFSCFFCRYYDHNSQPGLCLCSLISETWYFML